MHTARKFLATVARKRLHVFRNIISIVGQLSISLSFNPILFPYSPKKDLAAAAAANSTGTALCQTERCPGV